MTQEITGKTLAVVAAVPETTTNDELRGIAWWNGLDDSQRKDWMARAGNTGVAADAWAAFKRYAIKPPCMHCGSLAASGPLCDSCDSPEGWEVVRAQRLKHV